MSPWSPTTTTLAGEFLTSGRSRGFKPEWLVCFTSSRARRRYSASCGFPARSSCLATPQAANILENELLFRVGLASSLGGVALHTALTVVFCGLFRPVGRLAALLFASLTFVAVAVQAVSSLFQLPALIVPGDGSGVSGLGVEGSQSLAFMFLRWSAQTFCYYTFSNERRISPSGMILVNAISENTGTRRALRRAPSGPACAHESAQRRPPGRCTPLESSRA